MTGNLRVSVRFCTVCAGLVLLVVGALLQPAVLAQTAWAMGPTPASVAALGAPIGRPMTAMPLAASWSMALSAGYSEPANISSGYVPEGKMQHTNSPSSAWAVARLVTAHVPAPSERFDPQLRARYIDDIKARQKATMERIDAENAAYAQRIREEAASFETAKDRFKKAGDGLFATASSQVKQKQQDLVEAETFPPEVTREMRSAGAEAGMLAYSEALRTDGSVDGALANRLPSYLSEAGAAGVFQRAICFEQGSSEVAGDVDALLAEVAQAAARPGARVQVLGFASRSLGTKTANQVLAWRRAVAVKSLLVGRRGDLDVRAAGAFSLQAKDLSVDPNQFETLFGPRSTMAGGRGTPADRANQCAIIMVIPPDGFEATLRSHAASPPPT